MLEVPFRKTGACFSPAKHMHEKTNRWDQNNILVMQRREFAETALHFQVCQMECLIWEMQPVKCKWN